MGGSASDRGSTARGGKGDRRAAEKREQDRKAAIRALDKAALDNRSRQLNPSDVTNQPAQDSPTSGSVKSDGRITSEDAARIQSNADRTGKNDGFKERAQRAASNRD